MFKRYGRGRGGSRGAGAAGGTAGGAAGCLAEPLEERVLMAMSLKAGGSGFSNLLATDSAAVRQQKLIIDPPEPLAGSTSTLYDATKVTLRGATPGPGYDNQTFGGFVEVRQGNDTRLQPLDSFLRDPLGVETGYVQIRYQLDGQAGKIAPPRDWLVLDVGGTEGMDTHALDFEVRREVSSDNEFAYRVFAAKEGERSGNAEDFLITNDGTRTRLGPAELSPAEATTRPKDGSISGTVFEDFNGDRERNGDDKPLGDVIVFVDLDDDGKPDENEPKTQSNELGGYFFDDLEPGKYIVRELTPQGFLQTTDREGLGRSVTVEAGRRARLVDFGNARPGTVSGTVFNDLDGDGVRDAGEPGLAGAVVYVDVNNDGQRQSSEPSATSTDPAGAWSIGLLLPGPHVVRQLPPTGFVQTSPGAGPHVVTISSGGTVGELVFGDDRRPGPKVVEVFVRGAAWAPAFLKHLAGERRGADPAGYRIPQVATNVFELPWTNVNQVAVRFDQPVELDAGDLVIRGVRSDYAARSVERVEGMSNTFLFTLGRTLAGDGSVRLNGDRLLLDLNGDAPDGVGAADGGAMLDGDSDGAAGGDFRLRFDVLQGDVNHSGGVNINDFVETLRRRGSSVDAPLRYSVFHDVDGSGAVDATDAVLVRSRAGRSLPAVQQPAAGLGAVAPGVLGIGRRGLFGEALVLD